MEINNNEKIILEAIDLYEKGMPIAEILDLYPENKQELNGIFQIADMMKSRKEEIIPSQDVLTSILKNIKDESVTNKNDSRYLVEDKGKGRSHVFSNVVNFWNMNKRVYVGIGVVVLIFLTGSFYLVQKNNAPLIDALNQETDSIEVDINAAKDFQDDSVINESNGVLDDLISTLTGKVINDSSTNTFVNLDSAIAMEADLTAELSSFSTDLSDMSALESDASLNGIENLLGGI